MILIVCGNISKGSACPYQRASGGRLRPILRPCRIEKAAKEILGRSAQRLCLHREEADLGSL
jgi:hypothetical protein